MDSKDEKLPKKKRKKRRVTEADVSLFIQKYGRKAHRGHDPNDRNYSRDIEKKLKKMKPEEVDRLIRGYNTEPDSGSKTD